MQQGESEAMQRRLSLSSTVKLASGYEMPRLGLGVPAQCESLVRHAIKAGYRQIDSATAYRNEHACSLGIQNSPLPRSSIVFTTKLPPKLRGYAKTKEAINSVLSSCPALENYIDLYLIHAPYGGRDARLGQWQAMVEAHKEGKIRSLGVSNYGVGHLNELWDWIKNEEKEGRDGGTLSVGQWEVTPWCAREDIRMWCSERGVAVQAYSPLARATRLDDPLLKPLAEKYQKTPAQILLRWSLQMNLTPLPKSVHHERITENAGIFDFKLTNAEIKSLETGLYEPCTWDPTKEPV
ncbi:hypothetical protein RUND412_000045 [Rhizina undulata]